MNTLHLLFGFQQKKPIFCIVSSLLSLCNWLVYIFNTIKRFKSTTTITATNIHLYIYKDINITIQFCCYAESVSEFNILYIRISVYEKEKKLVDRAETTLHVSYICANILLINAFLEFYAFIFNSRLCLSIYVDLFTYS